ncbi:MAG TPA: TolC family protein [Planctomycetaceae bacterium]|nr:TolC family protein [Planctomycetaceae bacterium]
MNRVKFARLLSLSLAAVMGCKSGAVARYPRHETPVYQPELPPESAIAVSRDASETGVIQQVAAFETDESTIEITPFSGMSLDQLISAALSQNPDLVTLRQSEAVSNGALGVAQTYPFNPFVQFQVTPWQQRTIGGPGTTYHYVLLMQTIQLAHQQQFREQGASSALNSTRWNIHQAELLALAQTERLYFTALYLHGLKELAEANDRNNRQMLRIVENQLAAGQATAADVAIVRTDEASSRQQLQLASANYQSAVRDLARQSGMSLEQISGIEGDLRTIEWHIPGDAALESDAVADADLEAKASAARSAIPSWAASRPDVMAAQSDIDVARAGLHLASASKTPDLQIGPYYQTTADGTNFLGLRGQIDLPVINNGEPLEWQRSAEHRQRCTAWRQAQRRAELEAEAAFDRYETAVSAVNASPDVRVSELPEALEGLERQFLEGEVDIIRVIQARTSLIQNQRARLDLLNEVAQSAAALTGATGIPIEQIVTFHTAHGQK